MNSLFGLTTQISGSVNMSISLHYSDGSELLQSHHSRRHRSSPTHWCTASSASIASSWTIEGELVSKMERYQAAMAGADRTDWEASQGCISLSPHSLAYSTHFKKKEQLELMHAHATEWTHEQLQLTKKALTLLSPEGYCPLFDCSFFISKGNWHLIELEILYTLHSMKSRKDHWILHWVCCLWQVGSFFECINTLIESSLLPTCFTTTTSVRRSLWRTWKVRRDARWSSTLHEIC